MRRVSIFFATLFVVSMLFGSVCAAQAIDEGKIAQLRGTIEKLEGLTGDPNIPLETRQQLGELLFEKRGELHALLRQERDKLRNALQNATSDQERASLNQTIRQLTADLQRISGSAQTGELNIGVGEPAKPEFTEASKTGSGTITTPHKPNTKANGTNGVTSGSTVTGSPQPQSTQPAATTAQPTADAQDPCADLLNAEAPRNLDFNREVEAATCRMLFARTGRGNDNEKNIDFKAYTNVIALALARAHLHLPDVPELTAQAENASNSKDVSSSSSSAGSTSLVSKAGIPAVLGFAVENGALTKAISGTTVTFTGNPVGIIQTLAKKGFIDSFQNQDALTGFLRKLSFGVSFDTSRGTQPGTFTADEQQLSGFSLKYNLIDQRDPRSLRYTQQWERLTRKQASDLAKALNDFVSALEVRPGIPVFNEWREKANNALSGKMTFTEIKGVWEVELNELGNLPITPEMQTLVTAVERQFEAFIKERNNILDEISNGWIATFDYHNERPNGMPSLSNFRFLAEKGAYNGSIDFTGNASVTIYNSRPSTPNTGGLRDFRFAGQLDVPIGDVSKTGKFMFSFAGRYERLLNDELIPGTTTLIKKGDIAVGQFKFTIPIRGTAFKIPLSISVANRTELIQEREVRGNFGLTFDLDSILARFNPFSKP